MISTRIDAIVQFAEGSASNWSDVNTPVPLGVVIVDTVAKIVKEGNGVSLYADLPVCLDYDFTGGRVVSGTTTLEPGHIGNVAIASNEMYAPSTTKLTDLTTMMSQLESVDAVQQIEIDNLGGVSLEPTAGVDDGTVVLCSGGRYIIGHQTLLQLINDLTTQANSSGRIMHINDIEWYEDVTLTVPVSDHNLISGGRIYYARVTGWHDSTELRNVDFSMMCSTPGVIVQNELAFATSSMMVTRVSLPSSFVDQATDDEGNIYAVGYEYVVKFNRYLEPVKYIKFAPIHYTYWRTITYDSPRDRLIIAGISNAVTQGTVVYRPTIIAMTTDLEVTNTLYLDTNIAAASVRINSIVCDQNGTIYCGGYMQLVTGGAFNIFLLRLTHDMSMVAIQKRIVGSHNNSDGDHEWLQDLVLLGSNLYGVGLIHDDVINVSPCIMKFDLSLNLVASRKLTSAGSLVHFRNIFSTVDGRLVVSGFYGIVEFDVNLNILSGRGLSASEVYDSHIGPDGTTTMVGEGALIVTIKDDMILNAKKFVGSDTTNQFLSIRPSINGKLLITGRISNKAILLEYDNLGEGVIISDNFPDITISDYNFEFTSIDLTSSSTVNVTVSDTDYPTGTTPLDYTAHTNMVATSGVITSGRSDEPTHLLTAMYSSTSDDKFNGMTVSSNGNIICVGSTIVSSVSHAIVVVFDGELNPLTRKTFGDEFDRSLYGVVTDQSNNIICVGTANTGDPVIWKAEVLKFSPDLFTIHGKKLYSVGITDRFTNVTVSGDNIICVGSTSSNGSTSALLVKFDGTLTTVLGSKVYSGSGDETLTGVTTIGTDIICVGYTSSEGINTSGLLLKFDDNLSSLGKVHYNSGLSDGTYFTNVATDSEIILASGYVLDTVSGQNFGLLTKFDSELLQIAQVTYGSPKGNTYFSNVDISSTGEIVCTGRTNSEGLGGYDALIAKFDTDLTTVISGKTYGTLGDDGYTSCALTTSDDIIIAGHGSVRDDSDGIVVKLPGSLPPGVYTNKIFVNMVLADSDLSLANDSAETNTSDLSLTDGNLILNESGVTRWNAFGTVQRDVTIMDAVSNVFKVIIGGIAEEGEEVPVTFNVVTDDGIDVRSKTISIKVDNEIGLVALYKTTYSSVVFTAVATDNVGNILCAGYGKYSGDTNVSALIAKFDSNLNLLSAKYHRATEMVNRASVAAQETAPTALFFSPDGLKMFVLGYHGKDVNTYHLSTAWDVNTKQIISTFSVAAQETLLMSLFFSPDGLKMFVMGYSGDDVNIYNLSTAWNPMTAVYQSAFSVAAQDSNPAALFFSPDGLKMFITASTLPAVVTYSSQTSAWDQYEYDISSLGLTNTPSTFAYGRALTLKVISAFSQSVRLSYNSPRIYSSISSTSSMTIPDASELSDMITAGDQLYVSSTPWDLTTAVYQSAFPIAAQEITPYALFFSPDGLKMFVMGISGDDVNTYHLSTAWDPMTAVYQSAFSIFAQETIPNALFFSPDGLKMFVMGNAGDDINIYHLSTAWDPMTAVYQNVFSITGRFSEGANALTFSPDGMKMFLMSSHVHTRTGFYQLSVAWDVTTAVYVGDFPSIDTDSNPYDIRFSTNGLKVFVLDASERLIYTSNLTTAWDPRTAVAVPFIIESAVLEQGFEAIMIDSVTNHVTCVGTIVRRAVTDDILLSGLVVRFWSSLSFRDVAYFGDIGITTIESVDSNSVGNIIIGCDGSNFGPGLVIKLSSSLSVLSRKRTGYDRRKLVVDTNDDIIAIGRNSIIRLDSNMNVIRHIGLAGPNTDYTIQIYDVTIDSAGNIFCIFFNGPYDVHATGYISKFDRDLNLISTRHFGSAGFVPRSVIVLPDGDLVCVGTGPGADTTGYIYKFDTNLRLINGFSYGGTSSLEDVHLEDVTLDPYGKLIIAGLVGSEVHGQVLSIPTSIAEGTYVTTGIPTNVGNLILTALEDEGLPGHDITVSDVSYTVTDSNIAAVTGITNSVLDANSAVVYKGTIQL